MALLDGPKPMESPPGIAIASGALLACLMETLIKKGALTTYEVSMVVTAAQAQIANLPDSPAYNDARFVLQNLTNRFRAV